jgi:hypothetical protein
MTDSERLLEALSGAGVEFILVGGVAATVHGSARLTQDIDVVYARARVSVGRLERSGIRGSRCPPIPRIPSYFSRATRAESAGQGRKRWAVPTPARARSSRRCARGRDRPN